MACATHSDIPWAAWVQFRKTMPIIPRVSQPGRRRSSPAASTNFIFDENVHPDPDERRWNRELAAIAIQQMKLHLSLNLKPSCLIVTIRHYKISNAEGRWLPGGFHGAVLVMCRRMICGFYIKTRSRPSIPFSEVYLKTVIMYVCYNLQTKVKIAKAC